jgi:citrate synthase
LSGFSLPATGFMHDLTLQLIHPFWREEPFTDPERALLDALFIAHHRSAFRENPSSVTVLNAFAGSGDLSKAIAAAILTLGAKHAPLEQTVKFLALNDPASMIPKMLAANQKIPGWGGTFQKDGHDPIWQELDALLPTEFGAKLTSVTSELLRWSRILYPNPSAYTACVALALGLPAKLAPYLFIAARLSAWTQLAGNILRIPPP